MLRPVAILLAIMALLGLAVLLLGVPIWFLLVDRNEGTAFFDPDAAGDPLFYQHLVWFFGRAEILGLIMALVFAGLFAAAIMARQWLWRLQVAGLFLLTSALWLTAGLALMMQAGRQSVATGLHDTYYVQVEFRSLLVTALACGIFAAIYAGFRAIIGVRYLRVLALLHWALWSLGLAFIFIGRASLSQSGMPQRYMAGAETDLWPSQLFAAGGWVALVSFAAFAICVTEAIYRRIRHGRDVYGPDDRPADQF